MAKITITSLRDFPSIEELLQSKKISAYADCLPRPVVAEIVKSVIAEQKRSFKNARDQLSMNALLMVVAERLEEETRRSIGRVINATGIIVHTNLGRAPLSESLFDAIKATATGYGNIEFDLATGKRGKRGEMAEQMLAQLSGAEASTVVNNCAAALYLILNTFSNRKEVVISRGELVQIGGGFRIPDILKRAGAKLTEIGTTNITTIKDYESAISEKTGLLLKVHKSNFVQAGFTEEIVLKELVALGRKHSLPVVNDLGSGGFVPTTKLLGYNEPTVQQSVRDGADLTCFSGDKLLGGLQAGLIVGSSEFIGKLKKNPLYRALRVDKVVYAALEYLLASYLNGQYEEDIKLWSLVAVPESELYKRGRALLQELGQPDDLSVAGTNVYIGGGALPEASIPSVALVFGQSFKPQAMMRLFRELSPPVIGRIEDDRFMLDLKAIDESDLAQLSASIKSVLASYDK